MKIEFITDSSGKRKAAIVPIELFEKLISDNKLPELWDSVTHPAGQKGEAKVPGAVMNISIEKGVTLRAAWRLYRNLTQLQVAEAMGITQATVSAIERGSKPHFSTIIKLAALYGCVPAQLIEE
jgi:DNA-binding XRE family transcriptional regulator